MTEFAFEQPFGNDIPFDFRFDQHLVTQLDARTRIKTFGACRGQPGMDLEIFVERCGLVVLYGKTIGHDKMAEMMAKHALRFVEYYSQCAAMRVPRRAFMLTAHLKSEDYLALILIKSGRNMKRVIIQRAATKTIVRVQLLANDAGLSLRIGLHGLFFIGFGFFDARDDNLTAIIIATGGANTVRKPECAAVCAWPQVRPAYRMVRAAIAAAGMGKSSLGYGHCCRKRDLKHGVNELHQPGPAERKCRRIHDQPRRAFHDDFLFHKVVGFERGTGADKIDDHI